MHHTSLLLQVQGALATSSLHPTPTTTSSCWYFVAPHTFPTRLISYRLIPTLSHAGNVVLQPVPSSSPPQYAPLSNCTWVVQPAGMPYIRLSFSYFSTEPLYDTLLVEDADGVLAVVSGDGGAADLPGPFSTDTGRRCPH